MICSILFAEISSTPVSAQHQHDLNAPRISRPSNLSPSFTLGIAPSRLVNAEVNQPSLISAASQTVVERTQPNSTGNIGIYIVLFQHY